MTLFPEAGLAAVSATCADRSAQRAPDLPGSAWRAGVAGGPRGLPQPRAGSAAEPADIIICNGFAQAIDLVTQLVKARGGRRIAVEDPGDSDGRAAVGRHGLVTVPLPVDEGGISIDALRRSNADAVFLTPAHHYPTGAVMGPDRRADLLAWADERGALILEDDYDAEYRYDREPIGAITAWPQSA